MKKTILLATLSLTTAGYSLSGGLDYLDNGEGRAQQQPQAGVGAAGVGAAGAGAPRPMAGYNAGTLAALQNLQGTLDHFQGDPRLALPDRLPRGPLEPTALHLLPPPVAEDDLGTVHAPEYTAPDAQQLANQALENSAALGDADAMGALFAPGVAVTPDQATVDGVFREAIAANDYDFVKQMILNTPARPSADVANQILGLAMEHQDMDRADNALARIMFGILVPNPGHLDEYERPAALIAAAENGHTNVVRAYLNREISVYGANQWAINIALFIAAYNDHRDVVNILLPRADKEGIN